MVAFTKIYLILKKTHVTREFSEKIQQIMQFLSISIIYSIDLWKNGVRPNPIRPWRVKH